ncbi:MAG: hypothetical protein A2W31_14555 [Planctomycetes bacterium RBG_16_64_10]|nr:MAG: hypothetical protein A2W31_14555 [Planctomycetes bacterium RBG_16_64_10]
MNGKDYESDDGAATKVHYTKGQTEFDRGRGALGVTGQAVCRASQWSVPDLGLTGVRRDKAIPSNHI